MLVEVARRLSGILITALVVSGLLNVGLTQKPSRCRAHLREGRFLSRMLFANPTRESGNDIALAATVMTVLILGTVVLPPILLPP